MEKVAQITGLTPAQLFRYSLIAGVVLVMLGIGNTYITCLLGVAYPCFMSFLALESTKEDDDKQWLTYWVVFGIFNFVDHFAGFILSLVPFYFFLKLVFLVWLFHPSSQGATTIYNIYILPNMQQYEKHIKKVEESVSGAISGAKDKLEDVASAAKDQMSAPADEKKED